VCLLFVEVRSVVGFCLFGIFVFGVFFYIHMPEFIFF
jgi:hypothetical protein